MPLLDEAYRGSMAGYREAWTWTNTVKLVPMVFTVLLKTPGSQIRSRPYFGPSPKPPENSCSSHLHLLSSPGRLDGSNHSHNLPNVDMG